MWPLGQQEFPSAEQAYLVLLLRFVSSSKSCNFSVSFPAAFDNMSTVTSLLPFRCPTNCAAIVLCMVSAALEDMLHAPPGCAWLKMPWLNPTGFEAGFVQPPLLIARYCSSQGVH